MHLAVIDIGNTSTHFGLASKNAIVSRLDLPTSIWLEPGFPERQAQVSRKLAKLYGGSVLDAAVMCSVVPKATPVLKKFLARQYGVRVLEFNWRCANEMLREYPAPGTVGADRLANALAALTLYGKPVVVIGFGTAVTVDVVDSRGLFLGGAIAPGLELGLEYLHRRTAKLPLVKPSLPKSTIGRNTKDAMLVGCVLGHALMIRGLLREIQRELGVEALQVVATGGYAKFIASLIPEIQVVHPGLSLEGLRIFWQKKYQAVSGQKG